VTLQPEIGVVAQQGTQVVRPATTTTYTLGITEGPISSIATRTVTVKVATTLHVRVAVNPPRLAPRDRALISVAVTDDKGRAVPGAAVVIRAGGGAFADPKSRMGGEVSGNEVSASGQTDNDGVFSVGWQCVACAPGYVMTAAASKEGAAPGSAKFQISVSVRRTAS
jgi:hypothetical protein